MGSYPTIGSYSPVEGLVKNVPSTMITERQTPNCQNVRFRSGMVTKRPGMATLGTNLPVSGVPMLVAEYEQFDGTIFTLLFTTTDAYKFNTTTEAWDFITKQYTTGTVAVTLGSADVVGTGTTWSTNAVAGDKFRVGSGTWYTVGTVTDNTHITLTANYAGTTQTGQSYTIRNIFTGDEDDYFDTTFMNDTLIATNGKNAVMKWAGTGNFAVLGGATDYKTEALHYAKAVCEFKDRLFQLGTTEDSTFFPQRSRYSELGKTEEWNETQGGGFTELTGGPGNIFRAMRLGREVLAVYKENAIELAEYAGEYIYFTYRVIVEEMGLAAPRTLQNLGPAHIYLGQDDVYLCNGSSVVQSIGEPIRDELFSAINRQYLPRCFSAVDRRRQEYYLWIPTTSTTPDLCYIFDYRHGRWMKDNTAMTVMGIYRPTATMTWADIKTAATTWAGIGTTVWAEMKSAANRETLVVGNSAGNIYEMADNYSNDGSTAVDEYWESKDFQRFDDNGNLIYTRFAGVIFETKGSSVSVYYSVDEGASWVLAGTQTLTGTWKPYTFDFDITAKALRLRFRNNTASSSFSLRSFILKTLPRTEK